jgi:hypothetical protein
MTLRKDRKYVIEKLVALPGTGMFVALSTIASH